MCKHALDAYANPFFMMNGLKEGHSPTPDDNSQACTAYLIAAALCCLI